MLLLPDGSEYTAPITTEVRARALAPGGEVEGIIREATRQVEAELALEDAGWINLTTVSGEVLTEADRINNLKLSRLYYTKDPLGAQSVRLWTDYTFGNGMTWKAEDDNAQKVLERFWEAPENQAVLSVKGQRKNSDKMLVDGEIFFALFLGSGGQATIRRVDPLEISEIITDADDKEEVLYYKRQWSDRTGTPHIDYYRSTTNMKGKPGVDSQGISIQKTDDALVYHLPFRTISNRGNPLLLPALDWIKQYRRFLASRVAIMLAMARFAWKTKVQGGAAAVAGVKAGTHEEEINAGSFLIENMGVDTVPIKTSTNSAGAYQDGRMLKLQIAAAVGIPEQYYGDISIGNLATAKTVELPMMKMFQSYQAVWADTHKDIDNLVLEHNKISPDKRYVDRDFPAIAPADILAAAQAIVSVLQVLPELGASDDVKQVALMTLGIDDPAQVLDMLKDEEGEINPATEAKIIKALQLLREAITNKERKGEVSKV